MRVEGKRVKERREKENSYSFLLFGYFKNYVKGGGNRFVWIF